MFIEWIRDHKKLSAIIAVGLILVVGGIIFLISTLSSPETEEKEFSPNTVSVSNLNILYDHFSDYTIGYVLNALYTAVSVDQSMKNGSIVSENIQPATTATDEELYPGTGAGDYTVTVKDNAISTVDDAWGTWEVFTITTNDGRSFKVSVGVTPKNRDNDIGYTQISVIKQ